MRYKHASAKCTIVGVIGSDNGNSSSCSVTGICTVAHGSRHNGLLAGAGLQPWGCQSWGWAACFQGESFGSLVILFLGVGAGALSVAVGAGASPCPLPTPGLSTVTWLTFICARPLSGSLDCNGSMGCCLSGASRADGFSAHFASACAASILMRSWRTRSCCCSAMDGGSKRVCRSHCTHDAVPVSRNMHKADAGHERDICTSP